MLINKNKLCNIRRDIIYKFWTDLSCSKAVSFVLSKEYVFATGFIYYFSDFVVNRIEVNIRKKSSFVKKKFILIEKKIKK